MPIKDLLAYFRTKPLNFDVKMPSDDLLRQIFSFAANNVKQLRELTQVNKR